MSVVTNKTAQWSGSEPYFLDNFAPVADERTTYNLPVEGAIPEHLTGRYLRNGPNPTTVPAGRYHWFAGDGMVHGVQLRAGRATWYRNRWVRTERLAKELGVPAPSGAPEVNSFNPANTHIISHAGHNLACCEVGLPHELTPELETIGRYNFGGRLASPMTGHPKIDPVTGELIFIGYSPTPPYLRYHQVDPRGVLVRSEDIDVKGPTQMHDFAITAKYVIFFDLPVTLDPSLIGVQLMPYRWQPGYGARVGVMPRSGGNSDVRWFEVAPCYVYHALNAYEDGDCVVIDVSRYPEAFNISRPGGGDAYALDPSTLDQWRINLATGQVTETRIDDRPVDFPRVDERRVGRPYRYGYGVELTRGHHGRAIEFGNLLKYDRQRGTTEVHDFGSGRMAGEGVFVPAGPKAVEDEGWVLSLVYDPERDRSDLVILNAADFAGEPAARIHLPWRVPPGFHGSWIADPS